MTLPASFLRDGFLSGSHILKTRRLMIGSEGVTNTGKTEFALSAPGPGICLCLDRGIDGVLGNQNPPPTRNEFAYKVIAVPLNTQTNQEGYREYWKSYKVELYKVLDNKDCRSVVIDGDSDSWELQRLAAFGKLTQVLPIQYTEANAARRVVYARAYDSGKIIIATNKVKRSYNVPVVNADGTPKMSGGKQEKEWDGRSMERQGFADQDYLFQIQLRHHYDDKKGFGIEILKCKVDKDLKGETLWGDDCNMATLVQLCYPNVSLDEWGF